MDLECKSLNRQRVVQGSWSEAEKARLAYSSKVEICLNRKHGKFTRHAVFFYPQTITPTHHV